MSERFRLESLRIKGFRGFPENAGWQTLSLTSPCTVIYGIQGGGKSSVLHAIAWCLFGRHVANKSTTGIQERKNWLILNQYSSEAIVELNLRRGSDRLCVVRSTKKIRGKSPFFYTSETLGSSTNEADLSQLLGIALADYMSCVHLHQELVSGLMLQDPADRKKSFERLLGLTDLRNLLDGIKKTRTGPVVKDLKGRMSLVTQKLQAHLELRTEDLNQARREARRLGWSTVTEEEVTQRCNRLLRGLRQLGTLPEALERRLQSKYLSTSRGLARFLEATRDALRWQREQQPLLQQERAMRADKEQWLSLQKKLALMQQFVGDLTNELTEFQREHGTLDTLQTQLAASQSTEKSDKLREYTAFLQAALTHLSTSETEHPTECPLCQQGSFDVDGTKAHLVQQLKTLQRVESQQSVREEAQKVQQHVETLQKLKNKWERTCVRVEHGLQECSEQIRQSLPSISDQKVQETLHALISDLSSATIHQEPATVIAYFIEQVDTVLAHYDRWLEELQHQARDAQKDFRSWEEELETLHQARLILDLVEEVEDLQQLHHNDDIQQAQEKVQAVEVYVEQIKQLQSITEQTLQDLAQQKLGTAREAIGNYYRKLSGRNDFPEIVIDVEKFEVLAVDDGEAEVALRFFNKGDINCAALSIFLALASSSLLEHHLDFILLDDPSQHMDEGHKQKLSHVLAQVQQERQLVIATAEPDFLQMLEAALPSPQIFRIQQWNAQKGPTWDPPLSNETRP